jgi:hypothetical protein
MQTGNSRRFPHPICVLVIVLVLFEVARIVSTLHIGNHWDNDLPENDQCYHLALVFYRRTRVYAGHALFPRHIPVNRLKIFVLHDVGSPFMKVSVPLPTRPMQVNNLPGGNNQADE